MKAGWGNTTVLILVWLVRRALNILWDNLSIKILGLMTITTISISNVAILIN